MSLGKPREGESRSRAREEGEASYQAVFPFPHQPHTAPPTHLKANTSSNQNLILAAIQPRTPARTPASHRPSVPAQHE